MKAAFDANPQWDAGTGARRAKHDVALKRDRNLLRQAAGRKPGGFLLCGIGSLFEADCRLREISRHLRCTWRDALYD